MSDLITTIYGPMEARFLERRVEIIDNEREYTQVIMYFLAGQCVHRSPVIQLKQCLGIEAMLAQL